MNNSKPSIMAVSMLVILLNVRFTFGQFSATSQSVPQFIKRDFNPVVTNGTTQCQIYPTTMESWNQLGVDQFVFNFPGGKEMTLNEITFSNHITNFVCGLGENCLAGQQCAPFQGPLWFMLYSLQEWNLYVNSLYEATSAAISQVKEISISMITDFLISPTIHEREATHLALLLVEVAGFAVMGLSVGLSWPVLFPAWGVATADDVMEFGAVEDGFFSVLHRKRSLQRRSLGISNRLTSEAISSSEGTLTQKLQALTQAKVHAQDEGKIRFLQDRSVPDHISAESNVRQALAELSNFLKKDSVWSPLMHSIFSGNKKEFQKVLENTNQELFQNHPLTKRSAPEEIPQDNFAVWNTINTYLTSFSDHLRSVIAVTAQIGITAPLSSDEGVWGIIRGGKFLIPNRNMSQLQDKVKETIKLSALAQVFKAMNVFVTIESDKCNGKGENGAWDPKEHLSYCTPEGLMMNLIRAESDKSVNKIVNAHLISQKYGYTVEFLAQSAWSCQQKNLKIEGRPNPIGLKTDSKAGCTFDLPVCDTRIPEVAKLRKKHKTTVVACRRGLALNI